MRVVKLACETLPAFSVSSCAYIASLTASMSALVSVRSLACSFLSLTPHDQRRMHRGQRAAGAVRRCRRGRRRRHAPAPAPAIVRARAVVRVTGRVDAARGPCRRARTRSSAAWRASTSSLLAGGLGGLGVEEAAGRAREEERVVLLQVLGVDVRRIVGDRRRPGAGLLAELLDRLGGERNRRVHVAARDCRAPGPCAPWPAWPARSRAAPPSSWSRRPGRRSGRPSAGCRGRRTPGPACAAS